MDRIALPRGLIRYTTQNALDGRPSQRLHPRTVLYASLLGGIFLAGLAGLVLRNSVGLDVIRDRNALFRDNGQGDIENVYNLRILNKDQRAHTFTLAVSGVPGARVGADRSAWLVAGGEVYLLPVRVAVPAGSVHGGHDIQFTLSARDDPRRHAVEKARFIAP